MDGQSLNFRPIEFQDLDEVNKLTELDHYDVGLSNLQIYFNNSNSVWQCVENRDGKIVAVFLIHALSTDINYGYLRVVSPEYRAKGLTSSVKMSRMNHALCWLGSMGPMSFERYSFFKYWYSKVYLFDGVIPKEVAENYAVSRRNYANLVRITETNVDKIYEYDYNVVHIDRKEFLNQWCTAENSFGVMAVNKGQCTGFGVLRYLSEKRKILSPLYADDEKTAEAIFARLIEQMDSDTSLYLTIPSYNRTSFNFCRSTKLDFFQVQLRGCCCQKAYNNYVKKLGFSKIYSCHDYWPV